MVARVWTSEAEEVLCDFGQSPLALLDSVSAFVKWKCK